MKRKVTSQQLPAWLNADTHTHTHKNTLTHVTDHSESKSHSHNIPKTKTNCHTVQTVPLMTRTELGCADSTSYWVRVVRRRTDEWASQYGTSKVTRNGSLTLSQRSRERNPPPGFRYPGWEALSWALNEQKHWPLLEYQDSLLLL